MWQYKLDRMVAKLQAEGVEFTPEHKGTVLLCAGVNLFRGLIYTNNPHGIYGTQTFNSFITAFAGGDKESWELSGVYLVE